MKHDPRLLPWLELAGELEAFASFMHRTGLAPKRMTKQGTIEYIDVGEAAVARIHAIASNRWTWFSCQRDTIQGEVRLKLHTFHRLIAEGCFYNSENTDAGREMMERIKNIERKFMQLDTLSGR